MQQEIAASSPSKETLAQFQASLPSPDVLAEFQSANGEAQRQAYDAMLTTLPDTQRMLDQMRTMFEPSRRLAQQFAAMEVPARELADFANLFAWFAYVRTRRAVLEPGARRLTRPHARVRS